MACTATCPSYTTLGTTTVFAGWYSLSVNDWTAYEWGSWGAWVWLTRGIMWRRASTYPQSPLFTSLFNFLCPDPLSEGQSSSIGCPPFLIIHAFTLSGCESSAQHRTLAGVIKAGEVDSLHQSLNNPLQPSVFGTHRNLSPGVLVSSLCPEWELHWPVTMMTESVILFRSRSAASHW